MTLKSAKGNSCQCQTPELRKQLQLSYKYTDMSLHLVITLYYIYTIINLTFYRSDTGSDIGLLAGLLSVLLYN